MSGNKQREVDDQGNFVIDFNQEVLFEPIPTKTNQNLSHKLEKVHNLNELKIQLQEKLKSLPMKDDPSKTQHIVEQINEIIKQCDVVISQIQEKNNDEFDFVIDKQIKEVNDKVMHFETHINFVRDQAKRDADGKARELAELERQKSKQKIQVSVAQKTKVVNKEHFNDIFPEDNFTKGQKKLIAQDPRLAEEIRQQQLYQLKEDKERANAARKEKEAQKIAREAAYNEKAARDAAQKDRAKAEQAAQKDREAAEKELAAKLDKEAKLTELNRQKAEQERDKASNDKARALAAQQVQAARLAEEKALDAKLAREKEQAARLESEIRLAAELARHTESLKFINIIPETKQIEPPFKLHIVPEDYKYKVEDTTDDVAVPDAKSESKYAQDGINVNEFKDIAENYRKVAKAYHDCVISGKTYKDDEEKNIVKQIKTLSEKTHESVWLNEEIKRITNNYGILITYVTLMPTNKPLVREALMDAHKNIAKIYKIEHNPVPIENKFEEFKGVADEIKKIEDDIRAQHNIVTNATTSAPNKLIAEDKRDELQLNLNIFKLNWENMPNEYKTIIDDITNIYEAEKKLYADEYIKITIKKNNPTAQLQTLYTAYQKLENDYMGVKKYQTCYNTNDDSGHNYINTLVTRIDNDRLKIYDKAPTIDVGAIYQNIQKHTQKIFEANQTSTQQLYLDNKALLKKKEAERLVVNNANEAKQKITNLIEEHKLNVRKVVYKWQTDLLSEIDQKKLEHISVQKSLPFTEKIKVLVDANNNYYGDKTKDVIKEWYKEYHDTTIKRLDEVQQAAHAQVDADVGAPPAPAPPLPGAVVAPAPAPPLPGAVVAPAPAPAGVIPPAPVAFNNAYALKVLEDHMKFKDKTTAERKISEYKTTDINILKISDVVPNVELKAAAAAAPAAVAIEHAEELNDIDPIKAIDPADLKAALTNADAQIKGDIVTFSKGFNTLDKLAAVRDEYKQLFLEASQRDKIIAAYSDIKLADGEPLYKELNEYANHFNNLEAALNSNKSKVLLPDVESDLFKPYKNALIAYRAAYIKTQFINLDKADVNADTNADLASFKGVVDTLNGKITSIEKLSDIQQYNTEYTEVKNYDGTGDDYLDKVTLTGNFTTYHQLIIDAWDAANDAIDNRKLVAVGPATDYYNFDLMEQYDELIDAYNSKIVENKNYDIKQIQSYKNISKYIKNLLEISGELETKQEVKDYDDARAEVLKLNAILLGFIDKETPNTLTNLNNLGVEQKSYISAAPVYADTSPPYKNFQDALNHTVKLFNTAKIKLRKNELYNTNGSPPYNALQEFKDYASKDLADAFTYKYEIKTIDDIKTKFELQTKFIDDLKCATNVLFNPILRQAAEVALKKSTAAAAKAKAAKNAAKKAETTAAATAAKAAADIAVADAKVANEALRKEFTDELQVLKNKMQQYSSAITEYESDYKQPNKLTQTTNGTVDAWVGAINIYIDEYNQYLKDGLVKPDETKLNGSQDALIAFIKKALPAGMVEINNLKKELLEDKKLKDYFLTLTKLDLAPIKAAYEKQLTWHAKYLKDKCPSTLKNPISTQMHADIKTKIAEILDAHILDDIDKAPADLKNYGTLITNYWTDCKAYCDDMKLGYSDSDKSNLCAEILIIIDYLNATPYATDVDAQIQTLKTDQQKESLIHAIKPLNHKDYNSTTIQDFAHIYNAKINKAAAFNLNEKAALIKKLNDESNYFQISQYSFDLQKINHLDGRVWDYADFKNNVIDKYDKKYLVAHQYIVNTFLCDETYQLGQLLKMYDKTNIRHTVNALQLIDTLVTKLKKIEKYKDVTQKKNVDDNTKRLVEAQNKIIYFQNLVNDPHYQKPENKDRLKVFTTELSNWTRKLNNLNRQKKEINEAQTDMAKNEEKFNLLLEEAKLIHKWYNDEIKYICNTIVNDVENIDFINVTFNDQLNSYISFDNLKSYRYTAHTFFNLVLKYIPTGKQNTLKPYEPTIIIDLQVHYKYNLFPLTKLTAKTKQPALNKMLAAIGLPDDDTDRDAIYSDINKIINQIFPPAPAAAAPAAAAVAAGAPMTLAAMAAAAGAVVAAAAGVAVALPDFINDTITTYKDYIKDTTNSKNINYCIRFLSNYPKDSERSVIYQCISNHISDVKFKYIFHPQVPKRIKDAYNECVKWINTKPYLSSSTLAPNNGIIKGKTTKDLTGKTTKTPDQGIGRGAEIKIDANDKKITEYYFNAWEYDTTTHESYDDSKSAEYKNLYDKLIQETTTNLVAIYNTDIYTKYIDESIIDISSYIQSISGKAAWTTIKALTWDPKTMVIPDGTTLEEKKITDAINNANQELINGLSTTTETSPVDYIQSIHKTKNSKFQDIRSIIQKINRSDGNTKEQTRDIFINALKQIMDRTEAKPLWPFYNLKKPFISPKNCLKSIVVDLTISIQFTTPEIQDLLDQYNESIGYEFDAKEFEILPNPPQVEYDKIVDDSTQLNNLFKQLRQSSSTKRNYILYLIFNKDMVEDNTIIDIKSFKQGETATQAFNRFERDALNAIKKATKKAAVAGVKPNADDIINNFSIYHIPYSQSNRSTSIGNVEYYRRLENIGKKIVLTNDASANFGTKSTTNTLQEKIRVYYHALLRSDNVKAVAIYDNTNIDATYKGQFRAGTHKELYGTVLYAEEAKNTYTDNRKDIAGIYHVLGRHYVNSLGNNAEESIEVGRICAYYTAMLKDFEENKKGDILHLSLISGNQFNSGPITQYAFRRSVFQYCEEAKIGVKLQINVDLPKDITDGEKSTNLFKMDAYNGKPWTSQQDRIVVYQDLNTNHGGTPTKEMKDAYTCLCDIKDRPLSLIINAENGTLERIRTHYANAKQANNAIKQVESDAKQRLDYANLELKVARNDNGDFGYDAIIGRLQGRLAFFDKAVVNGDYLKLAIAYDNTYKQCIANIKTIADNVDKDTSVNTPERKAYNELEAAYKADITDVKTLITQHRADIDRLLTAIQALKANPPNEIKNANAEYAKITAARQKIATLKGRVPKITQIDLNPADEAQMTQYEAEMNKFINTDYKNNKPDDETAKCDRAITDITAIPKPGDDTDAILQEIDQEAQAIVADAKHDAQEINNAYGVLQGLHTSARNYLGAFQTIQQETARIDATALLIDQICTKYQTAIAYNSPAEYNTNLGEIKQYEGNEIPNYLAGVKVQNTPANNNKCTSKLLCDLEVKSSKYQDLIASLSQYLTSHRSYIEACIRYHNSMASDVILTNLQQSIIALNAAYETHKQNTFTTAFNALRAAHWQPVYNADAGDVDQKTAAADAALLTHAQANQATDLSCNTYVTELKQMTDNKNALDDEYLKLQQQKATHDAQRPDPQLLIDSNANWQAFNDEIANANPVKLATWQGLQATADAALAAAVAAAAAAIAAAAAVPAAAAAPAAAPVRKAPALGGYEPHRTYYKNNYTDECTNYSWIGWLAFAIVLGVVIYLLYLIFKPSPKHIAIYNFRQPISTYANQKHKSMYV